MWPARWSTWWQLSAETRRITAAAQVIQCSRAKRGLGAGWASWAQMTQLAGLQGAQDSSAVEKRHRTMLRGVWARWQQNTLEVVELREVARCVMC